jgi:NAD(P)H-dependent FMN reductase
MNLVIINGSPRGSKSNSKVIADWMSEAVGQAAQMSEFYLAKTSSHEQAIEQIQNDTTLLVLFPLYTDAMPAITKLFFERLESIKGEVSGVKVYFVVQSGFSGANHSRFVEKYLLYFAKLMGFEYMGTAVKPSGEGLRTMPPFMTRKTKKQFVALGLDIRAGKGFDKTVLKKLAKYEKPGAFFKFVINHTKLSEYFMSGLLKQNGAFENRFDTPYVD